MLPGVTPADPADRGAPDPALRAALESGDTASALSRLLSARLLLPVVATGAPATPGGSGHDKQAEMSVPALIDGSGARALPAFTGLEPLRRWRAEARPVPIPGARLIAGACTEGYDAVVVDVAGPYPLQLRGPLLHRLADAAQQVLASGGRAAVAVVADPDGDEDRC